MDRTLPDDVVMFCQTHLGSIWALEMMLVLRNAKDRTWTVDRLVREMRAANQLVAGLLERFQRLGLVTETNGTWRWDVQSPEMAALTQKVAEAHAITPFAVIQAIAETPEQRLRQFADAFRLRKD
jgi:hypothetical protein